MLKKYQITYQQYEVSQKIDSNCNSLQIVNTGASDILIDNILVLPSGATFQIDGNENEMCTNQFNIVFVSLELATQCLVIKKTYL